MRACDLSIGQDFQIERDGYWFRAYNVLPWPEKNVTGVRYRPFGSTILKVVLIPDDMEIYGVIEP